METTSFERFLERENYAGNTIAAYAYAVRDYYAQFPVLNKRNLLAYKAKLQNTYRPSTVNQRIHAMNRYLRWQGKDQLRLRSVKIPDGSFLENVISHEDFASFKRQLRKEPNLCYFAARYMAGTGARISELVRFRVEHVWAGYFDIYSKGGKIRRLYIPRPLRDETLRWLDSRDSGYLFLNRYGRPITPRGVANRLAYHARKYGIDPAVVHPHSFRHLYAKKFLERSSDLALLADLLGHENLSTTRVYLRKSTQEQRALIDRIVDW